MTDFLGGNNRDKLLGPARRCTATNRSGTRCGLAPIVGGYVCSLHGGKAPQVQQAARERLIALLDPAIDALLRVLDSAEVCEHCGRASDMSVMVRAAQIVLDRCGLGPSATLDVGRAHENPLAAMSNEELAARAELLAKQIRSEVIDVTPQE